MINQKSFIKERYETKVNFIKAFLAGISGLAKNPRLYLDAYNQEQDFDFNRRFNSTRFDNYVKSSYLKIAGELLSASIDYDKTIIDANENLKKAIENMDGKGQGIKHFVSKLVMNALINGVTPCLVDFKKNVMGKTDQDTKDSAVPVFQLLEQENICAYYIKENSEFSYFVLSSMLEGEASIAPNGDIYQDNHEKFIVYKISEGKVIFSNYYLEQYQTEDESGVNITEDPESITVLNTLDKIPVSLLSFNQGVEPDPFNLVPPLFDIAYSNKVLFQNQSAQTTILKVARFPMFGATGTKNTPPVEVNPFTWLHAEEQGAKFFSIETSGEAITAGKEDIEIAKQGIENNVNEFSRVQKSPSSDQETATASVINKDNDLNKVQQFAKQIEVFLNNIFNVAYNWEKKTKENIDFGFKIKLNSKSFMTDKNKDVLLKLVEMGVLSRETMLEEAKKYNVLDDKLDIQLELERIKQEELSDLEDMPKELEPTD